MNDKCNTITADHRTGIRLVDEEHESLFAQADSLLLFLESGVADRDKALGMLNALHEDAASHFANEEKIMRNIGYPGMRKHILQHAQLLEEFVTIKETILETDDVSTWKGMATILKHWVTRHVQSSDIYLREYVYAGVCNEKSDDPNKT